LEKSGQSYEILKDKFDNLTAFSQEIELGFSGLKQDLVSTANELCPRTSSSSEFIGARTHTEGLSWI
jgi:hypothetical protein